MVKILMAKELTEEALLKIPGVQGVGVGASSPQNIIVYVEKLTPQILAQVPPTIGGYPVQLMQSGIFRALSLMQPLETVALTRTQRIRPAPGGVSIGHFAISAGTLGGIIDGLIISNNHVLANASTVENPSANIGDEILQPGSVDSGGVSQEGNIIATLHSFVPLKETSPNLVDVAWAKPLSPDFVSEEILDIGFINGIVDPQVDMEVQKSGRTSALTIGTIIDVNATITVDYGGVQLSFKDQVISSKMMDPGDSGSLGLDMNNNLWGLGFAGSDDLSVFNKISNVLEPTPPVVGANMIPLLALGIGAIWLFMA